MDDIIFLIGLLKTIFDMIKSALEAFLAFRKVFRNGRNRTANDSAASK